MSDSSFEYPWIPFYEQLANQVLKYRDRRRELAAIVYESMDACGYASSYVDQFSDGTEAPIREMCPFTAMGIFNWGGEKIRQETRSRIAGELVSRLDWKVEVPNNFIGVPTLMAINRWFFMFEKDRLLHDIEKNWQLFEAAVRLADSSAESTQGLVQDFVSKFDICLNEVKGMGSVYITIGLFWCRPRYFPTLDRHCKKEVAAVLGIDVPRKLSGDSYLEVKKQLSSAFENSDNPIRSFVDLSSLAFQQPMVKEPTNSHITSVIASQMRERFGSSDRRELREFTLEIANQFGFEPFAVTHEDICPFEVLSTLCRSDETKVDLQSAISMEFLEFFDLIGSELEFHDDLTPMFIGSHIAQLRNGIHDRESAISERWHLLDCALDYAEKNTEQSRAQFVDAYDQANSQVGLKWKITWCLFLIAPDFFPCLSTDRIQFIFRKWNITLPEVNTSKAYTSSEYLLTREMLLKRFEESDDDSSSDIHSFRELEAQFHQNREQVSSPPKISYTLNSIIDEGCFLDLSRLEEVLKRLQYKKNLILQGPPGTGKTWLAKRLAYALIGYESREQMTSVQFHPNISYEDFVRGYRPNSDGTLDLIDGPFIRTVERATLDEESNYVVVIEEINRGNPAQVFGEMLTLLEADKRTESEALELSYSHTQNSSPELVYLPQNLYVIGTMNTADRSLAIVDFALRRRFAFVDLQPSFNEVWMAWLIDQGGLDQAFASTIQGRVEELNTNISAAPNLGPDFCVGHSFFTPSGTVVDPREWYRHVVETEIFPLLREYWLDDIEKAVEARDGLLKV